MGVPNQQFPTASELNYAEAVLLADQVMARAQAALRRDLARSFRRPIRSRVPVLANDVARWSECVVIAVVALACTAGYIVHGG